jgi:hypothetical protein
LSDREREVVLGFLNGAGRDILYECMHNCVYNSNIPRKERKALRKKLAGKEKVVTYLARPGNSLAKKKKLLKQTGGFLPAILGAVLPMLISALT